MKNTKRILSLVLVLAMAFAMLASCAQGNVASKGTAKLVVENGEKNHTVYTVDLSKLEDRSVGAMSLLEHVATEENSTLYYNVQWGGGYGAYITEIGGLQSDMSHYISIYTSEKEDFAVPSEYMRTVPTAEYKEMTLTYTGVGLSSMHVNDGTVILFRLEEILYK